MADLTALKRDPSSCRVLVVGSGKSGFAALRFLHGLGAGVSLSDAAPPSALGPELLDWLAEKGVNYETGGHSAKMFAGADLIVVSPGVPLEIEALAKARRAGIGIIGEMGLAAAFLDRPMVAVSGTNGKSTVTELIGHLLRAADREVFVGGNLGTPLCEYLLGGQREEMVVVEVSSFQLDSVGRFRPSVAVLLNISPDHLDRYASFAAYGDAKMVLFADQEAGDVAIVNGDDPEILGRLATMGGRGRRYLFSREKDVRPGAGCRDGEIVVDLGQGGKEEIYRLPDTLAASPNRENAMAAILAARLAGCPSGRVQEGLAGFTTLPHRLTLVAEIGGVAYYDDSKATNIGAVRSALAGMTRPVILIAGGRDKGGDYRLLTDMVRARVKHLLVIGEAKEKIGSSLADEVKIEMPAGLEEAVRRAAELAEPGDAVLLSPACASFDMFQSYGHRGEVFAREVRRLAGKKGDTDTNPGMAATPVRAMM